MLALSHPQVQWLSVSGDTISVEADGAEALKTAMEEYFEAVPSSRSSAEAVMEAGRFVSVWERARWHGAKRPGSLSRFPIVLPTRETAGRES